MAQTALRLRRVLSLSTGILTHTRLTTTPTVTSLLQTTPPSPAVTSAVTHHRHFHSTPSLSLSSGLRSFNDTDKIDPDSILFEGCDYNHWLIVMDFGKNPSERPAPDQMVETYVQTAAQVLGSVEVAKKRIYACSTTTYTGFQVEVDEDTSKKFESLPGVIFVLPDSYIDPVKKEYGGDKYINGEIIPRPPPVQHFGRTRRGVRPDDTRPRVPMHNQQGNPPYNQQGNPPYNQQWNPAYNQQGNPAYNQQGGPAYNQQGGPAYNQHGSMPGDGRGYRPQGPQHGFSPQQTFPSQHTGNSMPSGTPHPGVGMDGYQGGGQSNFVPSQQGNYRQDYNRPQSPMSNRAEGHGGYAQPGSFRSDSGEYGYNHPQGQRGNFPGHHGGQPAPGQMGISGDDRNHSPSTGTGDYVQRGAGSFEQSGATQYRQGPTGSYNQGAGTVYAPHGENQRFPQTSNEPSSPMEHRNYPPGSQTGFNQGRY